MLLKTMCVKSAASGKSASWPVINGRHHQRHHHGPSCFDREAGKNGINLMLKSQMFITQSWYRAVVVNRFYK